MQFGPFCFSARLQLERDMTMELTHFNAQGEAHMVSVGEKEITHRKATAKGMIHMNAQAMTAVVNGTSKKGDVLGIARIAGIMAVKKNAELIPLCHTILITGCDLRFEINEASQQVTAFCTVTCDGKTGVEMEAMTGVSIALLTIYDMLKAVDRSMMIGEICLLEKEGGKSGHYVR